MLDTGIQTSHASFGGRALLGIDLVNPEHPVGGDPNGHGTQVAGVRRTRLATV